MTSALSYDFDFFVEPKFQHAVEELAASLGISDKIRPEGTTKNITGRVEFRFRVKNLPNLNLFSMLVGAMMASLMPITVHISGQPISASTLPEGAQLVCDLTLHSAPSVVSEHKSKEPNKQKSSPTKVSEPKKR